MQHASTKQKILRRNLCRAALVMAIAVGLPAREVMAQTADSTISYNLPAADLDSTLQRFAERSGLQVLYRRDLVAGKRSAALQGTLSVGAALDKLLAGTGLIWERTNDNTAIIKAADGNVPPARKQAKPDASSSEAQPPPVTEVETVMVTGTNIRGTSGSSSPIIAFDSEEIAQSGVATVQQFFEKLPQNFGSGANAGNNANAGLDRDVTVNYGRGSGINLRGLGTGTTLTLLNGRRIAASNQFQYVDISLIPLSAVERIEVLTDGASAIYGADAIGGVVNIVLRKDFDGYETRLRYGSVTTGGLEEYQAGLTGGWNWDGGHALLSYEYLEQDNLSATDKAFSRDAPYQPYDLYPQSERNSLYGTISQEITPDLTLELNGIYAKREVRSIRAADGDFTVNVPTTKQYDLSAGLTYDLPASWQVRLNGAFGNSEVVSTGNSTTTAGTVTPSSIFRISSDSRYMDLAADGPLYTLPAGDIRVAIGATYRHDSYENEYTSGSTLQPVIRDSRRVASVYAESVIPIVGQANRVPGVERLEATLAARFDDYSDFGSTLNPKVGLAWEAVPGVMFRGTYGTSFRAPTFQDMDEYSGTSVIVGNMPNASSSTGQTLLMYAQGGNANLQPENATTWTAGVEFRPSFAPGFSTSLNYYRIKYTDRINQGFSGSFPTFFSEDTAPYASIFTTNPSLDLIEQFRAIGLAGAQYLVITSGPYALQPGQDETDVEGILDNRLLNVASSFQEGIDFDVRYGFDVGDTSVNLTAAGQYILENTFKVTSDSAEVEILNELYRPVDLKFRAGASVSRGAWSASASLNYVGSYSDSSNAVDPSVDAWKTVDLDVRYVAPFSAPAWLRDTSIALNVQNLFDRDPPFVVVVPSGTGFDPVNANPLGRFFSLTLTKSW